jgi:hypothetical protein
MQAFSSNPAARTMMLGCHHSSSKMLLVEQSQVFLLSITIATLCKTRQQTIHSYSAGSIAEHGKVSL